MDPEIPQLGPGFEPADPAVRGTDHAVFIEKRTGRSSCTIIPAAPTLSCRHSQYCQKISILFRRTGCGQSPRKMAYLQMSCFPCRKFAQGVYSKEFWLY